MAMSTRMRTKKVEENPEAPRPVTQAAKPFTFVDAKDKRKAFGDTNSRFGTSSSSSAEDKPIPKKASQEDKPQKPITAVYKDIKSRVDSRWKNPIPAVRTSKPSSSGAAGAAAVAATKPVPILKPATIRPKFALAETVTSQYKRATKTSTSSLICEASDQPLINSPVSFKLLKEKTGNVQKNFYESHSTRLIQQVEDIEDIDLSDAHNPQMVTEYVNDIYRYLFKLERVFPIRENFLAAQSDVTPKMRSVLLDWINEVHGQFSLELETYHMTVSMIDRYLQAIPSTPRRSLQLIGVTALFMASKYEELMPPEISDFVYVTDDTYTKKQILDTEKKIFTALSFNLAKPLPIHFLRRFAKAAGALGDRQYIAAKYFMELASIDYEMAKYKPSQIAAASLYLSLYVMNAIKSDDDLWTPTLEFYSNYTSENLKPIMNRLAIAASTARDSKLKSVFTKYSHASFKFTSTLSEMSGIKMNEIINGA